jgi:hypothetical protein
MISRQQKLHQPQKQHWEIAAGRRREAAICGGKEHFKQN